MDDHQFDSMHGRYPGSPKFLSFVWLTRGSSKRLRNLEMLGQMLSKLLTDTNPNHCQLSTTYNEDCMELNYAPNPQIYNNTFSNNTAKLKLIQKQINLTTAVYWSLFHLFTTYLLTSRLSHNQLHFAFLLIQLSSFLYIYRHGITTWKEINQLLWIYSKAR